MPTEKIKYSDNLKQGTDKLNSAIEAANTAETLSVNADQKATQALSNSEQTQTELTQAILAGDSSPLGGQLSVGAEGTVYAGPQERLLAEYNGLTADLADIDSVKVDKKSISAFSGLATALESRYISVALQVLGDSTGDASDEWVYKFAIWLKDKYPTWNVKYRLWSNATQDYGLPITLNNAPEGDTFIGGGTNTRIFRTTQQIKGDIDISVKMELADWTPATVVTPVSRYVSTTAERAWYFSVMTDGKLRFIWTPDGSTLKSHISSASVPFADGATGWVRVAFDANNEAGGCTAKFYTSTDGVSWTQLGTDITLAEVAVMNDASFLELGGRTQNGEILPSTGAIYEVYVRDGIGGYAIAPIMPDLWEDRANGLSHSILGAPTLTIVNGSHPGSNLVYLGETTRLKKMTPDYGQAVVLISNSHNEGASINDAYRKSYSSFVDQILSRLPYVPIIAIAQNPQKTSVVNYKYHAMRRTNIYEVAKIKNLEVADVYAVFPLDNLDPYMLDSVHPNSAGQDLWRDAIVSLWVN